jgi:hypothetical protein
MKAWKGMKWHAKVKDDQMDIDGEADVEGGHGNASGSGDGDKETDLDGGGGELGDCGRVNDDDDEDWEDETDATCKVALEIVKLSREAVKLIRQVAKKMDLPLHSILKMGGYNMNIVLKITGNSNSHPWIIFQKLFALGNKGKYSLPQNFSFYHTHCYRQAGFQSWCGLPRQRIPMTHTRSDAPEAASST